MATTMIRSPAPLGLCPDAPTPRLYDAVVEAMRVGHYSPKTEKAYVGWIRRYLDFHGRLGVFAGFVAAPQHLSEFLDR